MKRLYLTGPARVFRPAFGKADCVILAKTGLELTARMTIAIGDVVRKAYDHNDKDAVPFQLGQNTCYLLVEQVDISEAVEIDDETAAQLNSKLEVGMVEANTAVGILSASLVTLSPINTLQLANFIDQFARDLRIEYYRPPGEKSAAN